MPACAAIVAATSFVLNASRACSMLLVRLKGMPLEGRSLFIKIVEKKFINPPPLWCRMKLLKADVGFWIGALFFLLIILLIAKGLGWV